MNKTSEQVYKEITKQVAKDLKLPEVAVLTAYNSFWKFIKDKIEELPLKEDITEEEFEKLRTSFNVPSLGKIYTTYKRVDFAKSRLKYKLEYDN